VINPVSRHENGVFYSPSPEYPAGMKGKVNRAVARQSEGGFGFGAISL
jgi:hypothetical protein